MMIGLLPAVGLRPLTDRWSTIDWWPQPAADHPDAVRGLDVARLGRLTGQLPGLGERVKAHALLMGARYNGVRPFLKVGSTVEGLWRPATGTLPTSAWRHPAVCATRRAHLPLCARSFSGPDLVVAAVPPGRQTPAIGPGLLKPA